MKSIIAILFVIICTSSFAQEKPSAASPRARVAARHLADQWIETASADTLDKLALRSIAYAGMVPKLFVILDGHRMSATQALKDSALTILENHTLRADADAIRNTVYALTEISEGRTYRFER